MEPSKLSDSQLLLLRKNNQLPEEVNVAVMKELNVRGLSIETELEKDNPTIEVSYADIPGIEKFLIILFPFITVIHAILANRHISAGHTKKWKQHWKFVTIGYFVWLIIVVIFCIGYRILHPKDSPAIH